MPTFTESLSETAEHAAASLGQKISKILTSESDVPLETRHQSVNDACRHVYGDDNKDGIHAQLKAAAGPEQVLEILQGATGPVAGKSAGSIGTKVLVQSYVDAFGSRLRDKDPAFAAVFDEALGTRSH